MGNMDARYWGNRAFEGTAICYYIGLVIDLDACTGTHFVYGDFVSKPSDVVYYGCKEQFVWVLVLGAWASDVLVYKVYDVEVECKDVFVIGGVLGVGQD